MRIKKTIYFNHGITYLGYKGIKKYIFYLIEKLNLFFAYKTLTVSKEMKYFLDKIGSNISLINNGSACGVITSNKQNNKPKRIFNKRKLTIIYVGRLEIRKGIKVLIEILEKFKNSKNINFVFCGFDENEFYKFSKKKFKNLRCLGFIDNVNKVLENSDILILPSFHEGMPYSILEAMLNKTLIIGNDIPGIRSLIKHKYNGYLIKNNDAKLYISTISKLLNKEIDVQQLINNSLNIVQKFNRNSFMIEYGKFLDRVYVDKFEPIKKKYFE